jgi:cytochrome c-type biogenesis protein CcmF
MLKKEEKSLLPWVTATINFTLSFFLILVLFFENPFKLFFINIQGEVIESFFPVMNALQAQPGNGMGMNPLLRHYGMVVHPPMLYLGFVGFVVPFAYAIAALIKGRTDGEWVRSTRTWSLLAWLFLSIGLILGSRWAYDVLGWGGYWGWDAVEISAFMPWLTGTAYLHSIVMQEKRGLFKHWNIALLILTFCLVILGTFLTRSGLLSSVHAFSQSAIGPAFFIFISIMFLASLGLLLYRWGNLGSDYQISSFFSRESMYLFNNLLFMAIFLVCLTGVLFPIFSELITGTQVTVGPPFYEKATGPLFAALLLLMGVVPLTAWGARNARSLGRQLWKPAMAALLITLAAYILGAHRWTALLGILAGSLALSVTLFDTGRTVILRSRNNHESFPRALWQLTSRNRSRYGGYLIHIGIVLMSLGIIGIEFFQTETQVTLNASQTVTFAGYQLTYDGLEVTDTTDGREAASALVSLNRNGRDLGTITPRHDFYYASDQTVTIPGLYSTLKDELYVILVDWLPISYDSATFKVIHNPLINWLWIGSGVLILGTLVAFWPAGQKKARAVDK